MDLFIVLMAIRSKLRQKEISGYGPLHSSDGRQEERQGQIAGAAPLSKLFIYMNN